MVRQMIIELGGHRSQLGQVVPGAVGEIMMLHMVAQVEVEEIPEAEIIVSLLPLDNLVVLCDGVGCCGVGADGDKSY